MADSSSGDGDVLLRELAHSPEIEPFELIGQTIGRYRIVALLGKGGMGRVYEAEDVELGRRVAVKFVRPSTLGGPSGIERFHRERTVTAQLEHPGIVPVYDSGVGPGGEPFYVMRIARGEPLDRLLGAAGTLADRLALLPNVIAVAEAVAFAHSHGVVHRDLKPANVLVGEFGETLVADWGLAKRLHDGDEPSASSPPPSPSGPGDGGEETRTGTILGTPAYMAPEQAAARTVDERADVYAIGAMLHHLLTGGPPRAGAPMPPAGGALDDLVAITRKAIAADPDARYPRAAGLADDLRRAQTGQIVGARVYTRAELLRRWARRHRAELSLGSVLGLALVVVAVTGVVRVVHERNGALAEKTAAEAARHETAQRNDELVLLQARAELTRDPTAALAWLKRYPSGADGWPTALAIAADAGSRGVARQVWDLGKPLGSVAFAPDGAALGVGAFDGTLDLIEVATGARRTFRAEDGVGDRVVFAPDGKLIATTDGHESVRLWERATGASRRLAGEHVGGSNLKFSDDGSLLLVRHPGGGARMWRVPSGEPVALPGDDDRLAAFVPGGRTLAIGSRDGLMLVDADAGDAKPLARAKLDGPPFDVFASSDGRWIGASRVDSLTLWDPTSGEVHAVAGGTEAVRLLTPSPNGRWFMSCGRGSNDLWLFDIAARSARLFSSDEACARQASGFSPDGSVYLSVGLGTEIRLHEVAERRTRRLLGHETAVTDAAFSADGRLLASVSSDHTVRLWPLGAGDLLVAHDVLSMDPVAKAQVLVSRASTGALFVIHLHSGRWEALSGPRPAAFAGHGTMSADGSVAAFPDEHGAWTLVDLERHTRRPIAGTADLAAKDYVEELAPGGAILALADDTGAVRLVEVATGQRRELGRLGDAAFSIAFSRDGKTVAAGSRDGTARAWDVASGAERGRLLCQGLVWNLAFSPDGTRLAGACTDGIARVVTLPDDATVELRGHVGGVAGIDFTPDGTHLLTSGADGTIRLWELATRTGLIVRREPAATRARFSWDGSILMTQSGPELRISDAQLLPPLSPDPVALGKWIAGMTSATVDAKGHLATP